VEQTSESSARNFAVPAYADPAAITSNSSFVFGAMQIRDVPPARRFFQHWELFGQEHRSMVSAITNNSTSNLEMIE